jgi:molybdopterin-guanine dinucleotide biosynthesis protein A
MQGDGRALDKAMLLLDDETMLQRALRTVGEVCVSASVLCGSPERGERFGATARTVTDTVPGCGPLGGLDAALRDATEEWLLILPVDLPLMPARLLSELIEQGTDSGPGVACFEGVGRRQPLPVLIHRAAHPVIAKALAKNERKLMPVLQRAAQAMCHLGLCVLPAEEFASELDVSAWFTNVNTPDDYRAAQELLTMGNCFRPGASE